MQLNVLNLRSQVRFKTDISNTTTITNAEILTQLNEGYSKLSRAMVEVDQDYFEEQKSTMSLVALSSLYSLPTDCLKVKQVRLAYTTPDSEDDYSVATSYDPVQTGVISIDEINVPVSNPQVDITNNYLRIYPKPTVASSKGCEIYYIAKPSALVATGDVMIIPDDYHDLAATYAAGKVMERMENLAKADRFTNEFNFGLEKMKQELAGREMNKESRFKSYREITKTNREELPNA